MKCPKCHHEWRREGRSSAQNNYWWGVVVPYVAEATGFTHDEAHEALKAKFLGEEDMAAGLIKIGSTAKLDTAAFTRLIDEVRQWAQDYLDCRIPAPNEPDLAA
jgi:hypothetical protein